ncbi:hypothetical protein ABT294_25650 [Nonomuraea sp. NPDC000554]|uniref:type II toxin-antitoxin system RelE family toxin n=1 Tax=Nonomuraea sp. NPDC000554 TaxID=3154259 RepID=UPI00331A8453
MKGYFEILLAEPAADALRALHEEDPLAARFVVDWLEFISTDLESGGLRDIDKGAGLAKAAIGDFDALCWIRREQMNLIVLDVSRRSDPA